MKVERFKPRKAKHGFRIQVRLDTLRLCADLRDELMKDGGVVDTDFFIEMQTNITTSPSVMLVYVNGDAALAICQKYEGI